MHKALLMNLDPQQANFQFGGLELDYFEIMQRKSEKDLQKLAKLKRKLLKKLRRKLKQQETTSIEAEDCDKDLYCTICLDRYIPSKPMEHAIAHLPACGHYYHMDCLFHWLRERATCPVCRENISISAKTIKVVSYQQLTQHISRKKCEESVIFGRIENLTAVESHCALSIIQKMAAKRRHTSGMHSGIPGLCPADMNGVVESSPQSYVVLTSYTTV